jgi:hypothetical protein
MLALLPLRPARIHRVRQAPERVIPPDPLAHHNTQAQSTQAVAAEASTHSAAMAEARRSRIIARPFSDRSLHADALVVTDTRTAKSLTHLLRAGHRWQRNVSSLRMSQSPSDWEVRGFSECRVRRISGSIWHFLCGLVAT